MTWPRFTTVGHSLYYAWSSHKSAQLPSCQPHTNNNSNTTTGLYTDLKLARRDCDAAQLGPLSLPTTPYHELEHRWHVFTKYLTFFFLNCPSRFINYPPKIICIVLILANIVCLIVRICSNCWCGHFLRGLKPTSLTFKWLLWRQQPGLQLLAVSCWPQSHFVHQDVY